MIDWNGNGKIDPVDVGITMAILDDDDKKTGSPKGSGCLTALISLLALMLGAVIVLCALF